MPAPAGMTPRCRKLNSGVTRTAIEQRRERHGAGAAVDRRRRPIRRRIRVHDPLRRRAGPRRALRADAYQRDGQRRTTSRKRVSHCPASVHPGRMTESVNLRLDRPHRRFADHVQHVVVASAEGDADRILRHPDRAGGGAVRQEDLDARSASPRNSGRRCRPPCRPRPSRSDRPGWLRLEHLRRQARASRTGACSTASRPPRRRTPRRSSRPAAARCCSRRASCRRARARRRSASRIRPAR